MKKHCCEDMHYHATFKCDIHENPFDCPDTIILFDEKNNDYGLIIRYLQLQGANIVKELGLL